MVREAPGELARQVQVGRLRRLRQLHLPRVVLETQEPLGEEVQLGQLLGVHTVRAAVRQVARVAFSAEGKTWKHTWDETLLDLPACGCGLRFGAGMYYEDANVTLMELSVNADWLPGQKRQKRDGE